LVLFLLFDGGVKVSAGARRRRGHDTAGLPERPVFPIGVVELACLALYAIPRTSAVGRDPADGLLGGAVATHLRAGSPLLAYTLFPLYVAALVWGGLYLRDARLRMVVPITS
jgi:hypothetical protein